MPCKAIAVAVAVATFCSIVADHSLALAKEAFCSSSCSCTGASSALIVSFMAAISAGSGAVEVDVDEPGRPW